MLNNPLKEAERYIQNARIILSEKAEKDGNYYQDKKYIKMAGNCAWNGVLVALDAVLKVKENLKKGARIEYNDYERAIGKIDKKMPKILLTTYESLHKTLGYDGNLNYKIVQESIKQGENVIKWCYKYYKE